jgi:hypothetical protein
MRNAQALANLRPSREIEDRDLIMLPVNPWFEVEITSLADAVFGDKILVQFPTEARKIR